MDLKSIVPLEIEVGTLAKLLAGLYVYYTEVDVNAIPPSLFIEIAEKLYSYLLEWDYDKISFEDWIRTSLIIAPKPIFNEIELNELKQAEIYFERRLGNVTLIVSGEL